jgi:hypothetical protein
MGKVSVNASFGGIATETWPAGLARSKIQIGKKAQNSGVNSNTQAISSAA